MKALRVLLFLLTLTLLFAGILFALNRYPETEAVQETVPATESVQPQTEAITEPVTEVQTETEETETEETESATETEPAAKDPASVRIAAVGDIMFHRPQLDYAASGSGHDFSESFALISPLIQRADFAIGNFETTSNEDYDWFSYPQFNTPPQAIDAIRDAGFDAIIVATGSYPTMTETKGVDLPNVMTSDDLLALDYIPESMIVVGGGVIGLEFASIYQELGCQVTLLASRILKDADMEIRKRLPSFFKRAGMKVHVDVRALQIVETEDGQLKVHAKHKTKDKEFEETAKVVLIASGRGACIDNLNLDVTGVEHSPWGLSVDENLMTNVEGIYAIGDVIAGNPQLAHVASAQGMWLAEYLMDVHEEPNFEIFPACTFTLPEVSQVGLTELECEAKGLDYIVSKFQFAANAKAVSQGEGDGFVKLIGTADKKQILGAHIMGPHASDLIHECVVAMRTGLTIDELMPVIHAHPTLSEAVMEAIHGLKGHAIHMAPSKNKK